MGEQGQKFENWGQILIFCGFPFIALIKAASTQQLMPRHRSFASNAQLYDDSSGIFVARQVKVNCSFQFSYIGTIKGILRFEGCNCKPSNGNPDVTMILEIKIF